MTKDRPDSSSRPPSRGHPAVAGAVSALVASAVMLWMARATGGLILAQVIADRLIDLAPMSIFRRTLSTLETDTRPAALAGLTITQVVAGAGLGFLYARTVAAPGHFHRIAGASGVAMLTWLFLVLVASPAGGSGLLASGAPERGATLLTFAVAAVVFGLGIGLLIPLPAVQQRFNPTRRRLVRAGGLAVAALVSAGYIARHIQGMRSTFNPSLALATEHGDDPFSIEGMPLEVTPNDAFYVVSKNFIDPRVDASDWSLEIGGLVERPLRLSYTDMLLQDNREITATLECISNEVGGPYISNAVWEGFPLSTLLEQAGLRPGIVDLEIHAADGYVESIPIEKAMDDVMVVHTMNGEPLPDKHGYPVRLIVPGVYGKKNVKWVTALTAVPEDIKGYWQVRGWSDTAFIRTMSRIDLPVKGHKIRAGETLQAGGVAFSGSRGISKVEVSFDRGETWQEAMLSGPMSRNSWRLWRADYTATNVGKQRVIVRATDGQGELQDGTFREPLPEGSTGWHEDWFEVVED